MLTFEIIPKTSSESRLSLTIFAKESEMASNNISKRKAGNGFFLKTKRMVECLCERLRFAELR